MARHPWVRLWHTDLFGDPWFRDLSARGQSLYLLLLMHQANRGDLPGNLKGIARLLRVDPRGFSRLWDVLKPKFPLVDGVRANTRMAHELADSRRRSDSARENVGRRKDRQGSTDVTTDVPTTRTRTRVLPSGSTPPRSDRKGPKQHPHTLKLCLFLAEEIEVWKPGRKTTCTSVASLTGMDGLIRIDKRPAKEVALLIRWLFRAYEPQDSFDWRPNVGSGAKLRKQWDRLNDLRGGAAAVEKTEDQAFSGR